MGSAIDGLRHGVFDYLQKGDLDIPRLARAVSEAGERARLTRENRELLTRLQESNRLLKALHDVAAGIAGEPHLDRVLDKLMIAARILCHAAAGRVLLFGRTSGGDLFVTTGAGAGADALRGARLRPDESIAALVALENQAVVVSRRASTRAIPPASTRCRRSVPASSALRCATARSSAPSAWPGPRRASSAPRIATCSPSWRARRRWASTTRSTTSARSTSSPIPPTCSSRSSTAWTPSTRATRGRSPAWPTWSRGGSGWETPSGATSTSGPCCTTSARSASTRASSGPRSSTRRSSGAR